VAEDTSLRAARRRLIDWLLAVAARYGELLGSLVPAALARSLLTGLGALLGTVTWPFSSLRFRVRRAGAVLRPWSWGAFLGGNLATLLGLPEALEVGGWTGQDGARSSLGDGAGVVVLAAHAGPWEAGARTLAEMSLRPLVIVAPWPLLPRCEHEVLRLRARYGVASVPRGRRGWMRATRHLRGGGAVVVLVDSASAASPGRRPVAFIGGSIAAPDAVVAWAARNGAALWAAVPSTAGFQLHVLSCAGARHSAAGEVVRATSDRSVGLFRDAVASRPEHWAWIRPLVGLFLAFLLVLPACTGIEAPPPLPLEPGNWTAEASGVEWSGPLGAGFSATMSAASMQGRWLESGADGHFVDVGLSLSRANASEPVAEIQARSAQGRWPMGPFLLRDASWTLRAGLVPQLPEAQLRGSEKEIGWTDTGRLRCAGCALERIDWDLAAPDLGLDE
jgi:lauroyl/myristoyl acyltransferase